MRRSRPPVPRRSARSSAISAIWTRPRRRSRKPASAPCRTGRTTARRATRPGGSSSWEGTRRSTACAGGERSSRFRRTRCSPTSTTPRPSSPSSSMSRATATTSCASSSSAATRSCRRPSRSRWLCASSAACRSRRVLGREVRHAHRRLRHQLAVQLPEVVRAPAVRTPAALTTPSLVSVWPLPPPTAVAVAVKPADFVSLSTALFICSRSTSVSLFR